MGKEILSFKCSGVVIGYQKRGQKAPKKDINLALKLKNIH